MTKCSDRFMTGDVRLAIRAEDTGGVADFSASCSNFSALFGVSMLASRGITFGTLINNDILLRAAIASKTRAAGIIRQGMIGCIRIFQCENIISIHCHRIGSSVCYTILSKELYIILGVRIANVAASSRNGNRATSYGRFSDGNNKSTAILRICIHVNGGLVARSGSCTRIHESCCRSSCATGIRHRNDNTGICIGFVANNKLSASFKCFNTCNSRPSITGSTCCGCESRKHGNYHCDCENHAENFFLHVQSLLLHNNFAGGWFCDRGKGFDAEKRKSR